LAQSGDFLLAQGAGKYRESADESGKVLPMVVAGSKRGWPRRMSGSDTAPTVKALAAEDADKVISTVKDTKPVISLMPEYPLAPTSTLKPQSNPCSQLYADTREGRYRVGGNF
jgi:hypothetical protein